MAWAGEQARGTAQYLDDIPPRKDELQLVLVRSTKARAKIINLDLSMALEMPGVVGCVTAEDIGRDRNAFGNLVKDVVVGASADTAWGTLTTGFINSELEVEFSNVDDAVIFVHYDHTAGSHKILQ